MQDQHAGEMKVDFSQYLPARNTGRDDTGATAVLALVLSQEQSELDSTLHESACLYARPACG